MARPPSEGLLYMNLDVDMDQDDKVMLIEAKHGLAGFGLLVKLLMKIYKEGYYYRWTERELLLFSKRVSADINFVSAVINDCLLWEVFDPELYQKHQILTSRGIQKRYFAAVRRRTAIPVVREYLLVDIQALKIDAEVVSVNKNSVSASNNPPGEELMPAENPQSKVKEIESIVKECGAVSADRNEVNDDDNDAWVKVDRVYAELAGIPMPGPLDVQAMKEAITIAQGRVDLVIEVVRECFKNYRPAYPGAKIRSFKYFLPAIKEAAATIKARGETGGRGITEEEKEKIKELTSELVDMLPDELTTL